MTDDESKDAFMDLLSLRDVEEETDNPEENSYELQTIEGLGEEEIQNIALTELIKTIGFNTSVMQELKDMVAMGADSDVATSYSMVARANSEIIKTLSEFALQKERLKVQKEIKEMDIQGKKDVNEHKFNLEEGSTNPKSSNNTFILNMSRDQIFDNILKRNGEEEKLPIKNITPKPKQIVEASEE